MKVIMLSTMCGPDGNAFPGTLLDVPADQAKELLSNRMAREYDKDKDKNPKQVGLVKAADSQ